MATLGLFALDAEDYPTAREHYREALAGCQELNIESGVPDCLGHLGGVAAVEGDAVRAARLLGAASGLRDRGGFPVPRELQPYHDRYEASARQQLGPEQFEAEWRKGQAMPLDTIIRYALGQSDIDE